MHQAQRHPGISRVKKRALALDHVPVVGGVVGRQGLRRAGDEIGDHSVHGDTRPSDHDAGLAGRPEGGWHATRREGAGEGQLYFRIAQRQGDEPVYCEVKIMMIGGGAEEVMKELAARQLGL